jgi:hypothetical protein
MSTDRYLLILHQVDDSEGLVEIAKTLATADPGAEFVLLTSTTAAPFDLLLEPSGSPLKLARQRAERARLRLLAAGINLTAARMASFDPFRAVEDATRFSSYSAVIVAAPRHPVLHFLHLDLCCRLERRFSTTRFLHAPAPSSRSNSTPLQQAIRGSVRQ